MTAAATPGTIDDQYAVLNPRSRALFDDQSSVVPGGITHHARRAEPFPLFIAESWGARKRDVDGHEYIDYWLGHGAMLIGHGHPEVVRAVADQAARGLHGGGETAIAHRWAQTIQQMVPSAERVRFLSSGGEATQMAIRLARAFTGRNRIVKFRGCFHGWHDAVAVATMAPYDGPDSPGIPAAVRDQVVLAPYNDLGALDRLLAGRGDIAAVIMEPGGPFNDTVPSDPQFLRGARELTAQQGIVLIFDEVVTGFRYAPGGAQELFGVTPDLTTLGKVIGGGLPAGAVVGRVDIMGLFEGPAGRADRAVPHTGTWNALPVVAAAGVATLDVVRETDAVERARKAGQQLVAGINAVFDDLGVEAFAYGRSSIFKTCPGAPPPMVHGDFSSAQADAEQLLAGWGPRGGAVRKALLLEGVDPMRQGGFASSAHTEAEVVATCEAYGRAFARLRREGVV